MIKRHQIQVVIADSEAKNKINNHKYSKLAQYDINIIYAESINKLNRILLCEKVDILLFSFKQPDGNGIDYIKKIGCQHSMGIIILSEENNTDTYVLALEHGADDFIYYSNNYHNILSKIKRLYRRVIQ
jgi:DNA-binding response OmpR family regulator